MHTCHLNIQLQTLGLVGVAFEVTVFVAVVHGVPSTVTMLKRAVLGPSWVEVSCTVVWAAEMVSECASRLMLDF